MRAQSLIILGVAVLIGLAAVFLANNYLGKVEQKQATAPQGMVKVAVARVPLDFGAQLTPDKVKLVDWPASSIPPGTFASINQVAPAGTSRVALRRIEVGEPILRSKLSGAGGRASIAAVLQPDMRAAAVRVSDVSGVAGFVLPGDTVDVLVTRRLTDQEGSAQDVTDVLLQKVRVLAIDQDASDSTDKPTLGKTATLEVSQVDAQKLALAQQVGTLGLVLANPAAEPSPAVETVSVEDLRDGAYVGDLTRPRAVRTMPVSYDPPPRRWRPAPPRPSVSTSTVQIVRGTKDMSYEVGHYAGS